jgi:hypothetical protein
MDYLKKLKKGQNKMPIYCEECKKKKKKILATAFFKTINVCDDCYEKLVYDDKMVREREKKWRKNH